MYINIKVQEGCEHIPCHIILAHIALFSFLIFRNTFKICKDTIFHCLTSLKNPRFSAKKNFFDIHFFTELSTKNELKNYYFFLPKITIFGPAVLNYFQIRFPLPGSSWKIFLTTKFGTSQYFYKQNIF